MSEICVDCWNEIMGTADPAKKFIISRDLDLCEECGEWKRVIVRMKLRYIVAEQFAEFVEDLRRRKK